MPGSDIHQQLTSEAIRIASIDLPAECVNELIREYCLYPDFYFGRQEELEKYQYFTDRIQFHYLPDTPWNDVYRYWGYDEKGNGVKLRPYHNENFIHATNGFRFLITKIVEEWRAGAWNEGCRYAGTLLHMLEDSTFGPHAMEGPDGVDFFALNRMSGKNLVVNAVCKMYPDQEPLIELADPDSVPVLAGSVEEAVMMLYGAYKEAAVSSRQCCFREAVRYFTDTTDAEATQQDNHKMRVNAVRVCASVLKTCYYLAEGLSFPGQDQDRFLSEIEPYEFPFSGAGPYGFQTMKTVDHDLFFGIQGQTILSYIIAEKTFRSFETAIKLEGYQSPNPLRCQVYSGEKLIAEEIFTDDTKILPIQISEPGGMLAFKFRTVRTTPGGIHLIKPVLKR